jgi:hypothetical protein
LDLLLYGFGKPYAFEKSILFCITLLYVVDDVPIITWHTLTDFAPKSPSTTNFGNEAICVTLFAILPNLSNSACAFNGCVAQSET